MARIAFFTELLPPTDDLIAGFSYDLMCSLADQQHDVCIVSTYREGADLPLSHPRVEIIRPFRRWNWLEVPRLVPSLLAFAPDILHIIQPRAEALRGFTSAMTAIPALAPLLGRVSVVSSFYDLREESLRGYGRLLLSSQAVTVTNHPQLALLEKFFATASGRTPLLTVVPAPALSGGPVGGVSSSLGEFLSSYEKCLFIPGDIGEHRNLEELFDLLASLLGGNPSAAVVFGGGWGSVPSLTRKSLMRRLDPVGRRVLVTGRLSSDAENLCLQRALLVFTASLPAESLEVLRVLRGAISQTAPLVMSSEQADVDAIPWEDRKSSIITGSTVSEWRASLLEIFERPELVGKIRERLPEFSRVEAVDQPSNVMSRVYSGLLARR